VGSAITCLTFCGTRVDVQTLALRTRKRLPRDALSADSGLRLLEHVTLVRFDEMSWSRPPDPGRVAARLWVSGKKATTEPPARWWSPERARQGKLRATGTGEGGFSAPKPQSDTRSARMKGHEDE
jgi:hypothetical protein